MMKRALQEAARKGRGEDDTLAHVATGEMVIPIPVLQDNPELVQAIMEEIASYGIDPQEFIVGSGAPINPETGLPEYGFFSKLWKSVKSPLKKVSNIVLPNLGFVGGASNALIQGGSLKDALKSGLRSGAQTAIALAVPTILNGVGQSLGTAAGTTLDAATGTAGLQGATQGSGTLGALTRAASSLGLTAGGGTSALTGGTSSMSTLSDLLKTGASLYSYGQTQNTNDEILKQLQDAQNKTTSLYSPYTTAGTNALTALQNGYSADDYTASDAYNTQLEAGQSALQKALVAQRMSQSGAAVKAATRYAQNLASQGYQQSYNNWLNQQQSLLNAGYNATGNQASSISDLAGAGATLSANNQTAQNELLSSLLSGNGTSSLANILKGAGSYLFG